MTVTCRFLGRSEEQAPRASTRVPSAIRVLSAKLGAMRAYAGNDHDQYRLGNQLDLPGSVNIRGSPQIQRVEEDGADHHDRHERRHQVAPPRISASAPSRQKGLAAVFSTTMNATRARQKSQSNEHLSGGKALSVRFGHAIREARIPLVRLTAQGRRGTLASGEEHLPPALELTNGGETQWHIYEERERQLNAWVAGLPESTQPMRRRQP